MNSFATHERTLELVAEMRLDAEVRCFTQNVMLRVTSDAEVFLDDERRPSPYAPGHGDLSDALRDSGCLSSFIDDGGELLLMSNVDNLGATLDPAVIGAHLVLGGEMTAELVEKEPGDKGGAPARVDGKLQIVEEFRFPEAFDQGTIPVFNTNTFVFSARALARDFPLTWFAVKKRVDGSDVVQFERLAGELTSFLETRYLHVPRGGRQGRFQPVKDPDELERRRPTIEDVMRSRGVIR
jgi:UTP--glucose-1-phosphate uridylyltransferase